MLNKSSIPDFTWQPHCWSWLLRTLCTIAWLPLPCWFDWWGPQEYQLWFPCSAVMRRLEKAFYTKYTGTPFSLTTQWNSSANWQSAMDDLVKLNTWLSKTGQSSQAQPLIFHYTVVTHTKILAEGFTCQLGWQHFDLSHPSIEAHGSDSHLFADGRERLSLGSSQSFYMLELVTFPHKSLHYKLQSHIQNEKDTYILSSRCLTFLFYMF